MPVRSQEPLLGLPLGCRVPKPGAVLDCFPGPQAGSWMRSGAAGIGTSDLMESRVCKARTLTTVLSCRAQSLLSFFFKICFYFYWKDRYTERKIFRPMIHYPSERNGTMLCQSEARSLFQVSHAGAGSQSFGPSSTALPGPKAGSWKGSGAAGIEPTPICKARTLTTAPLRRAHSCLFFCPAVSWLLSLTV